MKLCERQYVVAVAIGGPMTELLLLTANNNEKDFLDLQKHSSLKKGRAIDLFFMDQKSAVLMRSAMLPSLCEF